MSFKVHLKLGGITNLSDARFAAAAGAEYLGFCFDPSSGQYIPPIRAKELIDWVTGPHIAGEFGNQSAEEIRDISELLHIDIAEIANDLSPEELRSLPVAIIKKIDTDLYDAEKLGSEMKDYHDVADAFHLFSGTQQQPDSDVVQQLCRDYKVIYGYPVNRENILEIIAIFTPHAINLVGGDEEKPGIKDFDELNDLLEMIAD